MSINAIRRSNQNRDTRIDILKFVCAILVLFLHTANLGKPYDNAIENIISQIIYYIVWVVNPVEFFFVASAFLLFRKIMRTNETEYNKLYYLYLRRLCILYLFWSLFYINELLEPFNNINSLGVFLIATAKVIRRFFLIGSSGHMWYILSLAYGLIILKPFLSKRSCRINKIYIPWGISLLLYVVSLLGDSYLYLLPDFLGYIFSLIRQLFGSMYLFRGPLFIMIGYSLANTNISNHKKNNSLIYFALWIGISFGNYIELITLKYLRVGCDYSVTVLKPITSYIMWRFIQNLKIPSISCSSFLAKSSSVMYFTHIFFRNIWLRMISDYFLVMIATFLSCIILTCLLIELGNYKKLKWINYVL